MICLHADKQIEAGDFSKVVASHSGMDGYNTHAIVGSLKIEHAEIADDVADFVKPCGGFPQLPRPVVTDARDHIDLFNEDPFVVVGHPIAGGVVDGVARRPTHPQKLGFGFLPITDAGDVLVAVAVELTGAHQHMAASVPKGIKNTAKGHPPFDNRRRIARTEGKNICLLYTSPSPRD